MKHFVFILLLSIMVSSACKKTVEIPACIQERIEAITLPTVFDATKKIDEYRFQNRTVYVFISNGSDAISVYDNNCNPVCILGGVTGNMTCLGENFNNAVFVKTIWQR